MGFWFLIFPRAEYTEKHLSWNAFFSSLVFSRLVKNANRPMPTLNLNVSYFQLNIDIGNHGEFSKVVILHIIETLGKK